MYMDNQEITKEVQKDVSRLIEPDVLKELNQNAEQLVEKMKPASDDDLALIMEQFSNLGAKEQRSAGESLSSLRNPANKMMANKDNTVVPDNLLKLREQVNVLNPQGLSQNGVKGVINRILRRNSIDKYISKYQSVEKNIEVIIKALLVGQDKLQEDNADLEIIKRDSRDKINNLNKQIHLGNQLFEILENKKNDPEWQGKAPIIMEAQQKISTRTQNMSTNVSVLMQALASVDIVKKTNDNLKEAIRNAIDTTKNIAPLSATIHMALSNQKTMINAIHNVNEATENMILANSQMLKENSEETTKLLERPSISIEKLQESFNNILTAIETQESSSRRIIENTREHTKKLEIFNEELKKKLPN